MVEDALPRLCLFGRPRLIVGETCIDAFATKRSAYLLARVAISRQKRMQRSELADVLWPDDYFDATRLRLRQELTRLRKTLGAYADLVVTQSDWVSLDISRVRIDVDDFESAFRLSREETNPAERERMLRQIVALGGALFMDGAQEDWIDAERGRLQSLRYTSMVDLGIVLTKQGLNDDALAIAREAIDSFPAREGAHLLAMQILGDMGHVADALSQYQVLRRTVSEEYGGRLSARAEQLAAGLRDPDPVPRSAVASSGIRYGVPVPPEPILGRERETSLICERLHPVAGAARLVTLLGIGGIGKTRVLIDAARQLAPAFDGRVVFADLTEISDTKLVPLAIMKAFGLTQAPTDDPASNLLAVIPTEPFLLALDNLEQLGSALAPLLRRLLAERPSLRLLNTSRTALNVSGEFRMVLTPLDLPSESANREDSQLSAATQLFVTTVEAGRMGTRISDADWPVIANIVRRLEGVPLALQLAASRFHLLGAKGLLSSVEASSEPLTNPREDAPARHRTIRSAVVGSFDQLDAELRNAMVGLSMFRGGWTLEAAGEVCGISNPMRVMERLLDASLVYVASDGPKIRFRMLEVIREFVLSTTLAEDAFAYRARHLSWMRGMARKASPELVTREVLPYLDDLEPENDNIRQAFEFALRNDPEAAFELAADLCSFWNFRTSGFEALRFYRELFERYGDFEPTPTILRAAYGHCLMALLMEPSGNADLFERSLAIGRALGDLSYETRFLVLMSYHTQFLMVYDRCRDLFRQMDAFVEEHGHFEDEGFIERTKGNFLYYQGEFEASIGHFQKALAWFQARGELFSTARLKLHLARAYLEAGDVDRGEVMLEGLLEEVVSIGFSQLAAATRESIGRYLLGRGRPDEAMRYFEQSEVGWREAASYFQIASQYNHRGRAHLAAGRLDDAMMAFAEAAEMWGQRNFPIAVAVALYGAAAVLFEQGDPVSAAQIHAAARREVASIDAKLVPFETKFADLYRARIEEALREKSLDYSDISFLEARSVVRARAFGR